MRITRYHGHPRASVTLSLLILFFSVSTGILLVFSKYEETELSENTAIAGCLKGTARMGVKFF